MAEQQERTLREMTVELEEKRRSPERNMQRVRTFSFSDPSGADPTSRAGHSIYVKQESGHLSMAIRESPAENQCRAAHVGFFERFWAPTGKRIVRRRT